MFAWCYSSKQKTSNAGFLQSACIVKPLTLTGIGKWIWSEVSKLFVWIFFFKYKRQAQHEQQKYAHVFIWHILESQTFGNPPVFSLYLKHLQSHSDIFPNVHCKYSKWKQEAKQFWLLLQSYFIHRSECMNGTCNSLKFFLFGNAIEAICRPISE